MTTNNTRNVGLDLLRIVSMLMVVCLHFFNHGGLVYDALDRFTPNWFIGNALYTFCFVAVNCLVLISGYFLCTSEFKLKKWLTIWAEALFYSVGIYLAFVVIGWKPFSIKEFFMSGLVLTTERYWFVTAYLLMLALSPLMNCAIEHMNKRTHLLCCSVLLGIFSLLHTIVYLRDFGKVDRGYSFLWFCILYVVAAYIRKYLPVEKVKSGRAWAIYLLCMLINLAERILAVWLMPKYANLFHKYNSFFVAIGSIALFLAFRGISTKGRVITKLVAFLAPISFGVYLIHDNNTMRYTLWGWLSPSSYADSPWMILYALGCVLAIFVVCCMVEWVRKWCFKKIGIYKLIDKVSALITSGVDKLLSKVAD